MDKVELNQLAHKQSGLFTRFQLGSNAVVSDLQQQGLIVPVLPGIFRLTAFPESPAQRNRAALLWRPGAVISHRSAGALFGWDRMEPDDVDISFAGQTRKTPPGIRMHTVKELPEIDVYENFGVRMTRPARTLIDLAAILSEEQMAYVLESAWRKKWIAMDWLKKRLGQRRNSGLRGARTLDRLIADCELRGKPVESVLEVRFWRWVRDGGLTLPAVQFVFHDDHGQPGRIDFAWPQHRLAVETRGEKEHATPAGFQRNVLRTARLTALGWRVMPVSWKMLDQRPAMLRQLLVEALEDPDYRVNARKRTSMQSAARRRSFTL